MDVVATIVVQPVRVHVPVVVWEDVLEGATENAKGLVPQAVPEAAKMDVKIGVATLALVSAIKKLDNHYGSTVRTQKCMEVWCGKNYYVYCHKRLSTCLQVLLSCWKK